MTQLQNYKFIRIYKNKIINLTEFMCGIWVRVISVLYIHYLWESGEK